MSIRDILVLCRPDRNEAVLAVTERLARRFGGNVRGLCVYPEPTVTIAESFATGVPAVRSVVHRLKEQADSLTAPAEAAFRTSLAASGAAGVWRSMDACTATQDAALQARLVDLVVMAHPGAHDHDAFLLAESLLLHGGPPCLFVPEAPANHGFARIVAAWNGTWEAKRAMDDALPLLEQAQHVKVLLVGEGVEMEGQDRVEALARHLERHGVEAELCRVEKDKRSVAEIILENCRTFSADLLVLGAYSHSRAREVVFGGVTRSILRAAYLPVLMSR